jgi:hypothetical protein
MREIIVIVSAVTIVAAALSGCATGPQYGSARIQQPVKYARPVGHDLRTFHDGNPN